MSDRSDVAAVIFERTAKLATSLSTGSASDAGAALNVAATIATTIAALIRAFGMDEVHSAIQTLVERRNDGTFTSAEIAEDDRQISEQVAELYADSPEETE